MFISPAFAQDVAAQEGSPLVSFVPLILIMVIFYFLILRPQQKRYKDHQSTLNSIQRGDNVVTGGGVIGKVTKVDDADGVLHVQIADAVTVKVSRATISKVLEEKKPEDNDKVKNKKASKKSSDAKVANDN